MIKEGRKFANRMIGLFALTIVAVAIIALPAGNAEAGSYGFDTFKSQLMQFNEKGYRDTGVRVLESVRDLGSGNVVIVYSTRVANVGGDLIGQNIGVLFTLWSTIHNRPPFSVTYYLGSTLIGKMKMTSSGRIVATGPDGRPLN